MMAFEIINEGIRFYKRRRQVRESGFKRYPGSASEICSAIIKDCYNRKEQYFATSMGNFHQFHTRDLGLCVPHLLRLGYHEEVHRTLQYALNVFSRRQTITTQITPDGSPVNSFAQSADALPFLVRSLRIAHAKDLIEVYRPFIDEEVMKYREAVYDPGLGLVKRKTYFSSIKDAYVRDSSCYDNCCLAMLGDELDRCGLRNPWKKKDIKGNIVKHLWNGSYFLDDLSHGAFVAGDANIFPYYFGIVTDRNMLKRSIDAIRKERLDLPFPLRYTKERDAKKEIWFIRLFAPNYEGTAIWMHLGLAYIETVGLLDKKIQSAYLLEYKRVIEKHKNFLEVFTDDGIPYASPFYSCDEGMLWAAIYLSLIS